MGFIAKVISISHAQFHCNGLTSVQDIQVYASFIFLAYSVVMVTSTVLQFLYDLLLNVYLLMSFKSEHFCRIALFIGIFRPRVSCTFCDYLLL